MSKKTVSKSRKGLQKKKSNYLGKPKIPKGDPIPEHDINFEK